ncbi:hypothetical protein [Halobellus salinisoli]|uniref:hypothetical protein n=1 Tax=Halobellus salinisoli TaxID=3108500 RepID=UPI003009A89B
MVVVSAVALVAGALCLYYGARALRTRRAIRRLDAVDSTETLGRRVDESDSDRRRATDHRDDVELERGFGLLALGLLCLLFGVIAL